MEFDTNLDAGYYNLSQAASLRGLTMDELLVKYTVVYNYDDDGMIFYNVKLK